MSLLQLNSSIPAASEKRLAVKLTPDAVRHVRSGHPWVYDQSITKITPGGAPGDLAVIFAKDRSFLAIGLYDPASPIQVKILHSGKPTDIDRSFWRRRVKAAAEIRSDLASSTRTTGYRCINGENDQMPGLILDRYGSIYVLKLYSAAWFPHLEDIAAALVEVHGPESIVLRLSRTVASDETFGLHDGQTIFGPTVSEPTSFIENDLVFEADVVKGQKTGYFLDQRDNRIEIGSRAQGSNMLDVFSCTGGFAVHAAAGGAARVTCVDQSAHALSGVKRNFELNSENPLVSKCEVATVCGDAQQALASMLRQQRTFDIVVVDPPSFAQKQASISGAIRSYSRLADTASQLVEPGGILFQASCSSRVTTEQFENAVINAVSQTGRPFTELGRFGHAVDHPVSFAQGGYLKAVMVRFDS